MGLFVATLVRDGQHLHTTPWLPLPIRAGRLRQSDHSQRRHRGRTHEGQRKGWQQAGEAVGISGFALVSSPGPPIGRGGVSRALQNRIIMVRARREAMRQWPRRGATGGGLDQRMTLQMSAVAGAASAPPAEAEGAGSATPDQNTWAIIMSMRAGRCNGARCNGGRRAPARTVEFDKLSVRSWVWLITP